MSKRFPYGNINLKGKLYALLTCGCCEARNDKKLKLPDYMKEYYQEISDEISDSLYECKEQKMKDLEKAVEMMTDKGYETAPLEELGTVYRPDGTLYCNFSVDSDFLLIKMVVVGSDNPITVRLDKKVIPVLKKFLESL